jgi:hypothetical protein
MKKTIKTLVVLGASIVLLGSQVCFAGNGTVNRNRTTVQTRTNYESCKGSMTRNQNVKQNTNQNQKKTGGGGTQQGGSK